MTVSSNAPRTHRLYERNAYEFVFEALRYTQETLSRGISLDENEDESAHISGQELLDGIRLLALDKYGLMTTTVFRQWGVQSTEDFGRIVFDLVERGEMKKTERDQLEDFCGVYDFNQAFDSDYKIDVSHTLN